MSMTRYANIGWRSMMRDRLFVAARIKGADPVAFIEEELKRAPAWVSNATKESLRQAAHRMLAPHPKIEL